MIEAHYWLLVYLMIGLAFAITSVFICRGAYAKVSVWFIVRHTFTQIWLWPGYIIAILLY